MKQELKPCVVAALESCDDYSIREVATRLMGSGGDIGKVLDEMMADPRLNRRVVILLAHMAYAGLKEYYGGWDDESAHWTLSREHALAEDLSNIEQQIETLDGRTTLKATKPDPQQVEVAQWRAECSQILADTSELRAQMQAQRPTLPPGSVISLRALALLRQRAAEE
jgi:hypothetical protein